MHRSHHPISNGTSSKISGVGTLMADEMEFCTATTESRRLSNDNNKIFYFSELSQYPIKCFTRRKLVRIPLIKR